MNSICNHRSQIRVAAYCRVSTDKSDQVNSFHSQQLYFKRFIESSDQWELYRIYADEGITGTSTRKRTAFNEMIQAATEGCFSLIITKEVSRFSRNLLDTVSYTRLLRAHGVGVLFLSDGIDTRQPDAELRLSIMGSIAQEESRKTSCRVKWGQTRRMEQGIVFGHSLLGYIVSNGTMTIEPVGAELVQMIFEMYGYQHKSSSEIADLLNRRGLLTEKGHTWSPTRIIKILNNEKYVGDLVQKKTITSDYLTHEKRKNDGREELVIIPNHHKPIVSRDLWNCVQEELCRNRRRKKGPFPKKGPQQ